MSKKKEIFYHFPVPNSNYPELQKINKSELGTCEGSYVKQTFYLYKFFSKLFDIAQIFSLSEAAHLYKLTMCT